MEALCQDIHKGNIEFLSSLSQSTLNELFVWACGIESIHVIRAVHIAGADCAFEDNRPLFAACEYGNLEAVKYLLSFSRVRRLAHSYGNRAYIAAQLHHHSAILEELSKIPAVSEGYKLIEMFQ